MLEFILINGWIFIILVIIIITLNQIGIFESLSTSSYKCELGDGLACINFSAETNDITIKSDGDEHDQVIIVIENQLHDIENFLINIPNCDKIVIPKFKYKTKLTYVLTSCHDLKPGKTFTIQFKVFYETTKGHEKSYNVNNGILSTYVKSPEKPEKKLIKDRIKEWFSYATKKRVW